MPLPGHFDNLAQVGVDGFPVKFMVNGFAAGNENIRIASATWANFGRDRVSGHGAGGVDYFFDAEATAVS